MVKLPHDIENQPSELDEVSIGSAAGEDEPQGHALVRLTDLLPRPAKSLDETTKYSAEFQQRLQAPAQDALSRGEAPEYLAATKAAFAATYHLKNTRPELQQDIVEESVAESLTQYVSCACGNIKVTCQKCAPSRAKGTPPAKSLELQFDIEGLEKLTRRICERLKARDAKRQYNDPPPGGDADDDVDVDVDVRVSPTRPSWNAAQRVEDNLIMLIDSGRLSAYLDEQRLVGGRPPGTFVADDNSVQPIPGAKIYPS